ncbi:MAG: transglutaminase [Candidatus Tokpelaia sp.]|nr:MAG: transglutaminase [Candidatus Tokpelaia sp.]KAA6207068.1 MAG: transglutaminase [Candidatus Tokpelaia sp.]
MRATIGKFLCCFLIFALGLANAAAAALTPAPAGKAALPALSAAAGSAAMETLGLTSQPVGHYDFCRRYAQQCRARKGATAPLRLTPKIRHNMLRVNAAVNNTIHAATDDEIYGQEEYWEYPDKAGSKMRGDCEDYVLLKQRELQKRGLPAAALLITVVRKPDGEAHAVLSVRTEDGDFILDNLRDEVLNWQETEYHYIKRQSIRHAGLWVGIAPRPALKPGIMQAKSGKAANAGSLASTRAITRP